MAGFRVLVASAVLATFVPPADGAELLKLSVDAIDATPAGGAAIVLVVKGGVADSMKIEVGDVVVRMNGKKVATAVELGKEITANGVGTVIWKKPSGKFFESSVVKVKITTGNKDTEEYQEKILEPKEVPEPK